MRELIREKDELTDLVKSMKKEMATMKGEITRLKGKGKSDEIPNNTSYCISLWVLKHLNLQLRKI